MYVHLKKKTMKEVIPKASGETSGQTEGIRWLHVFVIIGYSYRKVVQYTPTNQVRKMDEITYTEVILPAILEDMHTRGLTLWQDKDSAHCSKLVQQWCKHYYLPTITSPGNSPDLSIAKTMANPIKRDFHKVRCTTEKAAITRFNKLFNDYMDQEKIQHVYKGYTARLHGCLRREGQMTQF